MNSTSIKRFVRYYHDFGFKVAFGYIVMPYIKKRKGLPYKHRAVKKYLTKWASQYLDLKSVQEESISAGTSPPPIWVCWLQGEDKMPPIIKLCIESIRTMARLQPVVLISFDNIDKYVHVPESITQKLHSGQISYTHYADYLRVLLLKTHGGLWIDASIYATQPIVFDPMPDTLYTIKMPSTTDAYVSECKWTVSLLGCTPGNILFSHLELLLRKYMEDHRQFVDFFLFDYLIAILYDSNLKIRHMIDSVPFNNIEFYKLESVMNLPFDPQNWDSFCHQQGVHKLSWKSHYIANTADGKPTYFSHISN